ncbi:hypothetical protein N7517_009498 [Penicillium concentricum]|uniref:Uncharacterized protein n=1 Tax=Penicillium concentricum TaxID=293559 RepID=A0A9W9RHD3_9EURO|nr:uncharacterized protein N7517_009498 [Penicillium concentricum]KAJ5360307.1 hypothetical protein N7517_009498 [Penicillium concentricum]
MQRDVQAAALENFQETRDAFVKDLEQLSGGYKHGKTIPQIQADLYKLINTLSMWTLIRAGTEKEGTCFEERCRNLMGLIDDVISMLQLDIEIVDRVTRKLFDMATMQVGSLTLNGFSNDDVKAVYNARMIEDEQYRWERKKLWEDCSRQSLLRSFWARFYYKGYDCICRQCMDHYFPRRSPTPSPPLSPLPETDIDSYVTTSSEEE